MRGEVHDENAFALGGAAGHAGLFGTIDGVLDVAAGAAAGRATPALAGIRDAAVGRRAPWAGRRATTGWSGGDAVLATQTIGHTGFTGTGLWIDFDRGLAWGC